MKKLSKVSAFLLACAMSLSMGASAAEAQFKDIDTATNADSLSMLASLNVLNGYTDGTIRPLGAITRAEIAKMIYVIKMGGKDDGAAYYKSVKTNLTDIEGHWAEGYIKYCFSTGIVAGRDDNRFDPDANVTGVELAKMLLVIQGYNAQKAKLVGAGWANKVVELGAENEYFKGYSTLLNAAATREGAATIMVNALDATLVTWSDDANDYVEAENNKKTQTLGKRYFGLATYEGLLLATGEYNLGTGMGGKKKIVVDVEKEDGKNSTTPGQTAFDYETDASDLLGQYVQVSVDDEGKVYGIYAVSDKNSVVETTMNKVTAVEDKNGTKEDKIKIDSTTYKLDNVVNAGTEKNTQVFVDGKEIVIDIDGSGVADDCGIKEIFSKDEIYDAAKVRFIDNTGDGRFDIALINKVLAVGEVTSTTTKSFTAGSGIGKVNYEDVVYDKAFSKGDFVIKTVDLFSDKDRYELATVVEGEVTSKALLNGKRATIAGSAVAGQIGSIELDNKNWYTDYDSTTADTLKLVPENKSAAGQPAGSKVLEDLSLSGKVKLVVVGDVVYYCDVAVAGMSDIVYVAEAGLGQSKTVCKAKLIFTDGSTLTADCTYLKRTAATTTSLVEGEIVYNTPGSPSSGVKKTAIENFQSQFESDLVGRLAAYEIDEDGNYQLEPLDQTYGAAAHGYAECAELHKGAGDGDAAYLKTSKLVQNGDKSKKFIIDKDAVVFVEYKDNTKTKYSVISGADLLEFSKDFGAGGGFALTATTGAKAVQVAVIIDTAEIPGSDAGKGFAVVTSKNAKSTKIGSTTYKEYSVWTADGDKTIYTTEVLAYGDAVLYSLETNSGKDVAKSVETLSKTGAIYYFDGTKTIAVVNDDQPANGTGNTVLKLAADVAILNVDTSTTRIQGLSSDDISIATEESDKYQANAFYKLDGNGEVSYIVIDVNGEWKVS